MKKQYKLLSKNGKILILHWAEDGKLFGSDWEHIASFVSTDENKLRCKKIVQLMNECNTLTDHPDDDNQRD